VHPWLPFSGIEIAASALAYQAGGDDVDAAIKKLSTGEIGKRLTPVSDFLHDSLRKHFENLILDEDDYTELFDETEIMLAMIALDEKREAEESRLYMHGPWYGSFTWRDRHMRDPIEQRVRKSLIDAADTWSPLKAGLFGGPAERVKAVADIFVEEASLARQRRL
jgi:hypothetical protein